MQTYYAKSVLVSKTIWINLASLALLILETKEIFDLFRPQDMKYVTAAVIILNIILRGRTKRPVAFIKHDETAQVQVKSL